MNKILKKITGLTVLFAATNLTYGVAVNADLVDVTNGGGFFGEVTIANSGADKVTITADIAAPINLELTKGDILGLWLDVSDFTPFVGLALANVSKSDPVGTVSGVFADENNVDSLGGNNNLSGSGAGPFDLGFVVGDQGSSGGFNQTISFDLTATGIDASLFEDQRVGMRVQSIEGGTFGTGSSKLIGTNFTGPVNTPDAGSTLALMGIALAGLGALKRRK